MKTTMLAHINELDDSIVCLATVKKFLQQYQIDLPKLVKNCRRKRLCVSSESEY